MREKTQLQVRNMKKKILRGSLLFLIFLSIGIWGNVQKIFAAEGAVVTDKVGKDHRSFNNIAEAWNYAVMTSREKKKQAIVILKSDWIADSATGKMGTNMTPEIFGTGYSTVSIQAFRDTGSILVPKDAGIQLDLNGYRIDRGLQDPVEGGEVFCIEGALQIVNSQWDKDKKDSGIFGGNNQSDGGAVVIKDEASLRMKQGVIGYSNTGKNGGGIYLKGGVLELNDVIVENCRADQYGGGIYLEKQSIRWRLNDCTVEDCQAGTDGAGVFVKGSQEIILKGRTIVNNNSLTGSGKDSNIILSDGAWILDAGVAYDSDFNIGLINYKSNQVYMKNASQAKLLRGVYKVNEAYHSKDSSFFTEQSSIQVGGYSGSVFGRNPALIIGLLTVAMIAVITVVVLRKRQMQQKHDD